MANQNSESENQPRRFDPELLKKGLRCDLDQYDMLTRCSDKKDMTEWNEWRKQNPDKDVFLEGAPLYEKHLQGALLNYGGGSEENGETYCFEGKAQLNEANLMYADMEGANLVGAHLENASFNRAHLEGTFFDESYLECTRFNGATFDARASFSECHIDRNTDFRETNLETLRIRNSVKQLLEYNIRRMNWEEWYKEHPKLKWVVKPFWLMSDYGLSSGRIGAVFLGVVFLFANIYLHWGRIAPPGIIENLFEVTDPSGQVVVVPSWLVPLRTLYFSVAAMIGFSEVSPSPYSICGYVLIMVQAILGYVLLGALVTRFAVLFTAGGPAGKFSK